METRRRIAVIGAGASGLAAIKCCLDEGLHPVCFEKEDDIGGLWNYSDECKPGKGAVYKSCTINTSKEMMAYSDFPIPASFPPNMPHSHVLRYLRLYAKNFNLLRYVRFETCVENVRKAADFAENGRWEVVVRRSEDIQSDEVGVEIYDGVMVCSGHHVHPYMPYFNGLSDLKVPKLHSRDYRTPNSFTDQRVLVVGVGNSGVDIAVDISRVASQVFLSTRRGAWVIGRLGPLGIPADVLANSRVAFSFPRAWLQKLVEIIANYRFHHHDYGIAPGHRALEVHPTISDDLPLRISTGAIKVKADVSAFTPSGVRFTDASFEQIDGLVFATGYDYQFKFVDPSVLNVENNEANLYKFMWSPYLEHQTFAVIGLVQAIGSVIPISEMQARWFARVLAGRVEMPPREVMLRDIADTKHSIHKNYLPSRRHHFETFWISYMDEVAEMIGVRPNIAKLFLTDPCLGMRCFFGPCVPAQYRLEGPGCWLGAKKAIRQALSNNAEATRTRSMTIRHTPGATVKNKGILLVFLLSVGSIIFYLFILT